MLYLNSRKKTLKENGSILLISLLMLIIMTALGVTIFDITSISNKIVSNSVSLSNADASRDIAQTQTIAMIKKSPTQINNCISNTSPPCFRNSQNPAPYLLSSSWWSSNGITLPGVTISNVSQQPQFYIERFTSDNTSQSDTFRISAQGVGIGANPIISTGVQYLFSNAQKALPEPRPPIVDAYRASEYYDPEYETGIRQNFTQSGSAQFSGYISEVYFASCFDGQLLEPFLMTLIADARPNTNITLRVNQFSIAGGGVEIKPPFYVVQGEKFSISVQNLYCNYTMYSLVPISIKGRAFVPYLSFWAYGKPQINP